MEIPLFPLPNLVLFPNVIVPLHVFEDRYKQMINACIDNNEAFGIVLLREGAQEETEQTIHRVGATARIIQVERLDAGRMNVLCQGESRFRVFRFTQTSPFWKGTIDLFDDDDIDADKLAPLYDQACSLYKKAFELGVQLGIVNSTELRLPDTPQELSFMVSYVLDIESERKQKLLEMTSTELRLSTLVTQLDETIGKLEQQLAYKEVVKKVRGNGDLGKPADES